MSTNPKLNHNLVKSFEVCSSELLLPASEHEELRQNVQQLSVLSPLRTIWAVFLNWMFIVAVAYLDYSLGSVLLFPVVLMTIGARQQGLLVLMHEGAHFRIFTNRKWNDFFTDIFLVFPFFFSIKTYRNIHLKHHKNLNSAKDPDWVYKINHVDFTPPFSGAHLFWTFFRIFLGYGIFEHISNLKRTNPSDNRTPLSARYQTFRFLYYLFFLFGFSWFGGLGIVVKYWVLPMFFALPIFLRMRTLAEHFGLSYSDELNSSRTVRPGPVERFFFSPFGINYHIAHHLYPSVPFYNLKRLDSVMSKFRQYDERMHVNDSYVLPWRKSVLKDLIK